MPDIIAIFSEVVSAALPIAVVFALGGKIVKMFLSMAFGGRIKI